MRLKLKFLLLLLLLSYHVNSGSIVKFLPGFEGPLPFDLETGYIGIGDEEEVQFFYYFIKSENNPQEDPLLLWLNGGPGCSSLTGLLFENGPLALKFEVYNGSLPSLVSTTYSWTKVANIIFLDQPVGSGFSYSRTPRVDKTSDTLEVKRIHEFLQKWLSKHPQFYSNPFYATGDSYAGMIVPALVQEISKGNYLCCKPLINLQGYILGNPITDSEFEDKFRIPFVHGMALISDELYETMKRICKENYFNVNSLNTKCLKLIENYQKSTDKLNIYHILLPDCDLTSPDCFLYRYSLMTYWANDEKVREALYVNKVSSLIYADGKWDANRLNELFFPEDVTRILSSPPALNLQDSYFWAYSKDGNYSVRSGNKLIEKTTSEQIIDTPDMVECNRLKSKIWKLQTIPKIKMFLWRCLSGALAVKECLIAHGIQAPGNCSRCHSALESINHVLFLCFPAKRVWEISLLPLPPNGFSDSLQWNLDYILFSSLGGSNTATPSLAIPWIIWGIWKNRNEFIFEQKQGDLNFLISFAIEEASIWRDQLQVDSQSVVQPVRPLIAKETRWTKPAQDRIKCNIHSSWCNDRTFSGGSWIARDYTGAAIFHGRDAFTPTVNRISSELVCVLWALTSLRDLHIENVEVWSDCSSAVEALLNPQQWPKYRSLLNKVFLAGSSFKKISFHCSSPKANSVAREIAKSVTRDGRLRSYLSIGGPAWLHNRIEEDRRS